MRVCVLFFRIGPSWFSRTAWSKGKGWRYRKEWTVKIPGMKCAVNYLILYNSLQGPSGPTGFPGPRGSPGEKVWSSQNPHSCSNNHVLSHTMILLFLGIQGVDGTRWTTGSQRTICTLHPLELPQSLAIEFYNNELENLLSQIIYKNIGSNWNSWKGRS